MSKPEKNLVPISPVTAMVIISLFLLVPLLLSGFFSH